MSNNQEQLIQLSGELFEAVQLKPCFNDSKYFVDMTPKRSSQDILNDYKKLKILMILILKLLLKVTFTLQYQKKLLITVKNYLYHCILSKCGIFYINHLTNKIL